MTSAVNTQFIVGDETMRRVFTPSRLFNLSDLQAVLDAVEVALVNSSNAERGENSEAWSRLNMAESALVNAGFRYGVVHEGINAIASELKDAQGKLEEVADWPEWATKCLKIIRANTGADGYDDATEGIDLPGELEEMLATYEEENEKLVAKVEELDAKLETANALVHCVCGSRADQHGIGDGHSPVSAYHQALSNAEKRVVELEAERDELKFRMDGLEK